MASTDLTFAIKAVNDATAALKSVSGDIDKVGSSAEHSSGLLGKLGGALGTIGAVAGGFLAAKGIEELGGAIRGAFADAQDYQKMQAATNAVIESTGGKAGMSAKAVVDLANSLESVTAVDDQVIQGAENLLLTFTNIGKDVFPQATETVLNMSTALGQDATSSAVQLGKALNDPIHGVTALRRVGVSFTEAQLEQIKAMQESGDLMGAQKIILGELNTEFGGAARAAGSTFAGQLSLLKDTISDTFRDLAVKALPTLLEVTTVFAELLPRGIDLAGQVIGGFIDLVSPLATMAFDGLKDLAATAWDGLKSLGEVAWDKLKDAWEVVGPILVQVAGLAWDKLVELANVSWDKMSSAWDGISQKMGSIPWGKVKAEAGDSDNWAAAIDKVKNAVQPAIDVLKPLAEQALKAVRDQFRDVAAALGPFLEALKPLEPLLKPLAQILGVVIVGAIALLLIQFKLFTEFVTITLVTAINTATLVIKGITAAFDFVTDKLRDWLPAIGGAFGRVWDTVSSNVGLIVDKVKEIVDKPLEWLETMYDIGKRLMQKLWDGLSDKFGDLKSWVADHLDPRNWDIPGLSPLPDAYEHAGQIVAGRFVSGLGGNLIGGITNVVGAAQDALGAIATAGVQGTPMAAAMASVGGAYRWNPVGTPDEFQAALRKAGVADWAADWSTGYRGAAVGPFVGPITYADGTTGIAMAPDVPPAGGVPGYVTANAGHTSQMLPTVVNVYLDGQQISQHIEQIQARAY